MIANLFLGASLAMGAPISEKPQELEALLERVQDAIGFDELRKRPALELLGSARFQGVSGDYRLVSTGEGRFRIAIGGKLGETLGYDGDVLWRQERDGTVSRLWMEELDRHRLVTWVQTGYWLHESRPVALRLVHDPGQAEEVELEASLRGTPMRMRLWIDTRTWMPRRLAHHSESGTTTWLLEDYVQEDGFHFPRRVRVRAGENTEDLFEVSGTSWIDAPDDTFQRPTSNARLARFSTETPSEIEMQRTFTGHLLVQPLINGRDEGWFLLDSGAAAMVIDSRVAEELEMASFGEVLAVGGAGRVRARYREGRELKLGPLTLEDPIFIELDIGFLSSIFGVEVAGICGYDVFAHAVVEMEPANDYAAIHDPTSFELADGSWQGLVLDERIPCIQARFEGGHSGLFKIDTGANGTVTFHAPAVARLGLLQGRELQRAKTGGVGGLGDVLMGTLEWFELGGRRFDSPTVGFSRTDIGGLADPYTLGNLGQGLLSSFRLVFDYSNERFALRPIE